MSVLPRSYHTHLSKQTTYLIFKRYEPEHVAVISFLLAVVPTLLMSFVRSNFSSLLGAVFTTYISFWLLIVILTVGYRLSPFHPLAKYPGPLLCKISKGWVAYVVAGGGKAHIYVHELHKQYNSDIIRIGQS